MSVSRRTTIPVVSPVSIVSMLLGILVMGTPAVAQDTHITVPPDQVKWGPAPPFLPAGAQIAVLEGNPAEKGSVTLRLKFPANYVIPPHWHSMAERLTIISGTFNVGSGDTVDRAASVVLGSGGFASLPAKMHHYAWVKVPTVVQVNLEGPFDIFYINPSDDPRKASTSTATRP